MTTYHVPEMHCATCVKRIENALSELSIDFLVSLENKTVTTNGNRETVISTLEDLGFTPEAEQTPS